MSPSLATTGSSDSSARRIRPSDRVSGTVASPLVVAAESDSGAATLTNGTIYEVQLRAVNAAGPGAASETLLAAPHGTPLAPTAVSVAAANGALVLSFTADCKPQLAVDPAWTGLSA